LELSRKNKENSLKATNPHYLGSRGYASKMDEFESELEQLERLGVEPETADWELRSVYSLQEIHLSMTKFLMTGPVFVI